MSHNQPVYSPSVLDMFTVANEYSIFLEKVESYEASDIITYLSKILPLMYLKGSLLSAVEVEFPEANERYVTEEQWQEVFNTLRLKFGDKDIIYHCDPGEYSDEMQTYSLSENLADIYQDMKDFVLLYSKESHAARENAVNEIFLLFCSHWGHRVLISLMHIHYLLHRDSMQALTTDEIY